jgi:hypothetical protein
VWRPGGRSASRQGTWEPRAAEHRPTTRRPSAVLVDRVGCHIAPRPVWVTRSDSLPRSRRARWVRLVSGPRRVSGDRAHSARPGFVAPGRDDTNPGAAVPLGRIGGRSAGTPSIRDASPEWCRRTRCRPCEIRTRGLPHSGPAVVHYGHRDRPGDSGSRRWCGPAVLSKRVHLSRDQLRVVPCETRWEG